MGEPIRMSGTALAKEIKAELALKAMELKAQGKSIALGTLLVGADAGSVKYVAGKHRDAAEVGIESIGLELPKDATELEILEAVQQLNDDPRCTGYIVQLPLPKHINTDTVLDAIDPNKDADGLHAQNLGHVILDVNGTNTHPEPCTPLGVINLIRHYLGNDFLDGKNVCVIGRGITIGRSIGALLTRRAINATVTLTHTGTRDLANFTKSADVIVAAAGSGHLVTPSMLNPEGGQVLIDVGVSLATDGKVVGDIDPACFENALAYSPNPGGVGPMTRAMLIDNVVKISEQDL